MTHELALLAALFKPHMHCAWKAPKDSMSFTSDNTPTPGGTLLYQRNYGAGFEEVIVYAYDAARRRYVRTQLSNGGDEAAAASVGPVNGTWRFTELHSSGKAHAISWKRSGSVSRYWYDGVAGMGECH